MRHLLKSAPAYTTLCCILTFSLCAPAVAAVQLVAAPDVRITAINGKAVNNHLFTKEQHEFTLPAGQTTITVRYDRLFEQRGGDHEYIKSRDITLAADLVDNARYQLTATQSPKSLDTARQFAKSPQFSVIAQNARAVPVQVVAQTDNNPLALIGNLLKNDDEKVDNYSKFVQLWAASDEATRARIVQYIGEK